jgi:Na+(H+)/acetate symporter ActP
MHVRFKRVEAMKKALLTLAVLVVYILHQDVWFFHTARPLVFGFVPVGLAYHAAYSVLAALLMWLLVRLAWPSRLEDEAERHERTPPRTRRE